MSSVASAFMCCEQQLEVAAQLRVGLGGEPLLDLGPRPVLIDHRHVVPLRSPCPNGSRLRDSRHREPALPGFATLGARGPRPGGARIVGAMARQMTDARREAPAVDDLPASAACPPRPHRRDRRRAARHRRLRQDPHAPRRRPGRRRPRHALPLLPVEGTALRHRADPVGADLRAELRAIDPLRRASTPPSGSVAPWASP